MYAFQDGGYTQNTALTGENGQAHLRLGAGTCTFQVDRAGFLYPKEAGEICAVPTCLATTLTIPVLRAVTIRYRVGAVGQADLPVYCLMAKPIPGSVGGRITIGWLFSTCRTTPIRCPPLAGGDGNGATTRFTMDLEGGLTQALSDGTHTYLYGAGRIAQDGAGGAEYFLGDALGSVRQVSDADGGVTLAKNYEPYGDVLSSAGNAASSYGFTGEWTSSFNGLVYLRARWYAPQSGRFTTRDTWQGAFSRPLSLNRWSYVEGNPVNFTDPSGYLKDTEEKNADNIREELKNKYGVLISKDYGWKPDSSQGYGQCSSVWKEGAWKSIDELKWVKQAVIMTAKAMGSPAKFKSAFKFSVNITRVNAPGTSWAPPGALSWLYGNIVLRDHGMSDGSYIKHTVIHELGHVWDERSGWKLSTGMKQKLGMEVCSTTIFYGQSFEECHFDVKQGKETWVGHRTDPYPNRDSDYPLPRDIEGPWEDWADSFAVYVYPDYFRSLGYYLLGPIREKYINDQIKLIP